MAARKSQPIRVLVADKAALVRRALEGLFAQDPRLRLVGVVEDGQLFLEALERFEVDVGVIGWVMPRADGHAVLAALRARGQEAEAGAARAEAPPIVVYTGHPSSEIPRQVMRLGGAGFCSKSSPPEQLLETVVAASEGRMVFPMIDVRSLGQGPLATLTERERELLAALSEGTTNSELARRFRISLQTVKYHLKNVYLKVGVSNRAQAVALYLSQSRSSAEDSYPKE